LRLVTPVVAATLAAVFLCSLAGGVARVTRSLLLSLEKPVELCLLGGKARSFFGCEALGFRGGSRRNLGLAGKLSFLLQPNALALGLPLRPGCSDRLALAALFDHARIVRPRRRTELFQHGLACLCRVLAAIVEI